MQLIGVGTKIFYKQKISRWLKPNGIKYHWVIVNERYFYCESFEQACEKYNDLNLKTSYNIFGIYDNNDDFERGELSEYIRGKIVLVEIDAKYCLFETLREGMAGEDYAAWQDSIATNYTYMFKRISFVNFVDLIGDNPEWFYKNGFLTKISGKGTWEYCSFDDGSCSCCNCSFEDESCSCCKNCINKWLASKRKPDTCG